MNKRKRETPIVKRKLRNTPVLSPPFNIDTLSDLLNIAWSYKGEGWFRLWSLIPALTELDKMVGLSSLKKSVVDMVVYNIQSLDNGNDMMNTVLYGKPGTGKTSCAHILAKIYSGLGLLPSSKITIAKRSDFLGKYVGHTEAKTTKLLNSAKGGVLFIDEAYSMGCSDRTDSFSKAAVDLLNQFLTENVTEIICIIAGYEKELDESFFSINPGLKRRFSLKYKTDDYTHFDLAKIFEKKVREEGWMLETLDIADFFKDNERYFEYAGGDVENFLVYCKYSHASRIFGDNHTIRKLISLKDMNNGILYFDKNRRKEELSETIRRMYI